MEYKLCISDSSPKLQEREKETLLRSNLDIMDRYQMFEASYKKEQQAHLKENERRKYYAAEMELHGFKTALIILGITIEPLEKRAD